MQCTHNIYDRRELALEVHAPILQRPARDYILNSRVSYVAYGKDHRVCRDAHSPKVMRKSKNRPIVRNRAELDVLCVGENA